MVGTQEEHSIHIATIANAATESDAVHLGGQTIVGFEFPASFEGATVTLKASTSFGGTYMTVKKESDGTDYTVYAGASAHVPVAPGNLSSIQNIKVVSATAMGAEREVKILARPAL